ncbi:MAG: hypothetical protein AABY15_06820 [Nanoarchaeota archaeon]
MKKPVTVQVQIQMDIDPRKNAVEQIKDTLETMNKIVGMSELDASPQIFVSDISASDVIDAENDEEE